MARSLKDTISQYVIDLFKRRGATVSTTAITATQATVSKTVDRETKKVLVNRSQLTVSG